MSEEQLHVEPNVPVIRGLPKHRCPICQHVCQWSRKDREERQLEVYRSRKGRPPSVIPGLLKALEYGSREDPVSSTEIQKALNISPYTVIQYIYRARRAGYMIASVYGVGYYVVPPDEEYADDSREE